MAINVIGLRYLGLRISKDCEYERIEKIIPTAPQGGKRDDDGLYEVACNAGVEAGC